MSSILHARVGEMSRNLRAHYRHRTAVDEFNGRYWYDLAHGLMIRFAERYQVPIATAACVTAALSPQCSWEQNVLAAEDVLSQRNMVRYGPLPANVLKARSIMFDHATSVFPYFSPRATKVAAFAQNLAGNLDVVTVDEHAVQAAFNDVAFVWYSSIRKYEAIASAYVDTAERLTLSPAVLQAIVWHIWKRRYPAAQKRVIRRQW